MSNETATAEDMICPNPDCGHLATDHYVNDDGCRHDGCGCWWLGLEWAMAYKKRCDELQGRLDIVEALAAGALGRPWARVADQIIATCHGAVAARS